MINFSFFGYYPACCFLADVSEHLLLPSSGSMSVGANGCSVCECKRGDMCAHLYTFTPIQCLLPPSLSTCCSLYINGGSLLRSISIYRPKLREQRVALYRSLFLCVRTCVRCLEL